ncbi:hypothetical protein [Helcococcus kunzii]|uniref:hypothetical protein n=1 Tax=Helcococcus kunzii TaxID=40091 RepID=UPI0024ACF136|nr:hypothetical protein [Helcococcus kunzii]
MNYKKRILERKKKNKTIDTIQNVFIYTTAIAAGFALWGWIIAGMWLLYIVMGR